MNRWPIAIAVACAVATLGAADTASIRVSINGRVTRLALEEYVARVVAGEGQPAAAAGAQQALAITARTYALANLNRHRREGYDLCDTTHCQVVRAATEVTRRAAQLTAGRVLLHKGQPATVFYSALCGGHSELASQVWPGADDSSSHLHEDDACRDEPEWSSVFRANEIERALRALGHRGRLRDVKVVQRNASGRVVRMRVDGVTPNEISGHDFRMAVTRQAGLRSFKSTAFEVRRAGGEYRFTGRGFGHGVGLCVIGAGNRAAGGASADAILKFYFPNLLIGYMPGLKPGPAANDMPGLKPGPAAVTPGPAVNEKPGPGGAGTRAPASAGAPGTRAPASAGASAATGARVATDVLIESAAPGDGAEILKPVRAARDQISKAAGVKAPPTIQVTIHPTVDAFVRHTGQPWWVSGAGEGTQLDLVPLAILRQRGQLELTIRREVGRILIESALRRKPMWVREGAASYFADPTNNDSAVRGSCPKDEELLRPASAGAHRAAIARADACFRREIAKGKKWSDVP